MVTEDLRHRGWRERRTVPKEPLPSFHSSPVGREQTSMSCTRSWEAPTGKAASMAVQERLRVAAPRIPDADDLQQQGSKALGLSLSTSQQVPAMSNATC